MGRKNLSTEIRISYRMRGYIALTYLVLAFLPVVLVVYLYESGAVIPGRHTLAAFIILMLVFLPHIAQLIEYLLIGRNLKKATEFCKIIRQGNYLTHFKLPTQKDDENAFLDFLRNLEMVANHIRGQNRQLMRMLNESKDKAQEMQELAVKDGLTGLYNRRYFDACLQKEAEKSAHAEESISLILLDCDKFKQVNDQHGHSAGDKVLRSLAETMLTIIRADKDVAFRFGGDEFGIIMPGADINAAVKAANRLREHYAEMKNYGTSLSISVTSLLPEKSKDMYKQTEKLIITTDKGIYDVKDKGGNGVSSRIL